MSAVNPALRDLGFGPNDRVVVVHADDVGMFGATVDAFFDLAERGLVSSGSAMVPCPWFPDVARRAHGRADVDIGVHLTLNCEWDGYRWAPLSTRDPASGIVDDEGYMFRSPQLWRGVDEAAVRLEMEVQLDRAGASGLEVTHVDSHMFAVLTPGLAEHYVEVGRERGLPVLLTRQPQWVAQLSENAIAGWEADGMPVFDHLREMPLTEPTTRWLELTTRLFDDLPPGLTYLVTHPAAGSPELRAVATDWRQRVADYEIFACADLHDHLRRIGVDVIGWRPLRDLLRQRLA